MYSYRHEIHGCKITKKKCEQLVIHDDSLDLKEKYIQEIKCPVDGHICRHSMNSCEQIEEVNLVGNFIQI